MRRKELWRKVEKTETTPEKGAKQYKYLYRRMLDENIIRKAYKSCGKAKRSEKRYNRLTPILITK